MDILDLSEELKHIQPNGVCLNLDERIQLELSLHKLSSQINAEELLFWGKISGINNDYYIAVAYTYSGKYEFPHKQFYWALSSNYEFQEFPDLNDQHKQAIDSEKSLFEGNPAKKLVSVTSREDEEGGAAEEAPEGGEDGEGEKKENQSDISEEEEIKIPPKDLTELDRLAYVVYAIENDCQLAPSGAFKMTPQHQVKRNEAFKGLNASDCLNIDKYFHFRNVQQEDVKANLDLPNAPFNPEFLDPINRDLPLGRWGLQIESNKKSVQIRSMMWPGFYFFHKLSTKKFGNIYIGEGLKNEELQFII